VTKPEAIQTLLECDWLDEACKNIGKSDWEELRQRFWARILEQTETTFERIRDLRFYCVRAIMNEQHDFNAEKKRHTVSENLAMHSQAANIDEHLSGEPHTHLDLDKLENIQSEYQYEVDNAIQEKDAVIGKIPMYDRVIFKLHEKGFSCRAIARYTDINRNEINATVNRVKQYIAANVRYERASN
jgi:hypothetical protein